MMLEETETLLAFFKALAHESRLRMVGLLAEQERSVDELATLLALKPPTISHHLARLRGVGLVEGLVSSEHSIFWGSGTPLTGTPLTRSELWGTPVTRLRPPCYGFRPLSAAGGPP